LASLPANLWNLIFSHEHRRFQKYARLAEMTRDEATYKENLNLVDNERYPGETIAEAKRKLASMTGQLCNLRRQIELDVNDRRQTVTAFLRDLLQSNDFNIGRSTVDHNTTERIRRVETDILDMQNRQGELMTMNRDLVDMVTKLSTEYQFVQDLMKSFEQLKDVDLRITKRVIQQVPDLVNPLIEKQIKAQVETQVETQVAKLFHKKLQESNQREMQSKLEEMRLAMQHDIDTAKRTMQLDLESAKRTMQLDLESAKKTMQMELEAVKKTLVQDLEAKRSTVKQDHAAAQSRHQKQHQTELDDLKKSPGEKGRSKKEKRLDKRRQYKLERRQEIQNKTKSLKDDMREPVKQMDYPHDPKSANKANIPQTSVGSLDDFSVTGVQKEVCDAFSLLCANIEVLKESYLEVQKDLNHMKKDSDHSELNDRLNSTENKLSGNMTLLTSNLNDLRENINRNVIDSNAKEESNNLKDRQTAQKVDFLLQSSKYLFTFFERLLELFAQSKDVATPPVLLVVEKELKFLVQTILRIDLNQEFAK
jgi:hypothetical protein